MNLALELLARTDMSITAVSELLGYAQRNKFDKSFKKVHGATRKTFRLNGKSGPPLR